MSAAIDASASDPPFERRDGMLISLNLPIPASDGIVLRADVFRPDLDDPVPVLLTYGPYAKGLAFQDGFPTAWQRMVAEFPEVERGSSGRYQNWEVPDPEKWVPDGYACVRVDSRGAGRSPGRLSVFSRRETQDLFECIEWAGNAAWSNGKVGLNGISYYAMNMWHVAALQPPHLAAMCVWEGAADFYRDASHHGGIPTTFWANWYEMQVTRVQHGVGSRGPVSRMTGEPVAGPQTLSDAELAANRDDLAADLAAHPLDDEWHRERSAHWDRVTVPFLSAGNWGGQGLHLRGNVEGFLRAAARRKWLEMHGLDHWTHFYTDYGLDLQKRFFGHFLQGRDTGWDRQPPVVLQVRHADGGFTRREEHEWPLARTRWTKLYFDLAAGDLVDRPPSGEQFASYEPLGHGLTFVSSPLAEPTEITGPSVVKLLLSSQTTDADVFVVLRVFDPQGTEVVFRGALDPHTPVGQGWLRASHRELDDALTLPYRPYHRHDRARPIVPGVVYELDVEILPTSIVVPAGYRVGVTILGRDYEHASSDATHLSNIRNPMRGSGPFLHDDRPGEVYGGTCTIHSGAAKPSYVLLPVVPPGSHGRSSQDAP